MLYFQYKIDQVEEPVVSQELTKQQQIALRANPVARRVRADYPKGQRVEGATGYFGTVQRHIPMLNALGGVLIVLWDNGTEGRHSAIDLLRAAP